jgi:lactate permease
MIAFLASVPLILFFIAIIAFKRSVIVAAILALVTLVLTGVFVWEIEAGRIVSASLKGSFIALEIIAIVFGALLILEALKVRDYLSRLRSIFEYISSDKRVHVILIGWSLIYFLEGVAGFGTPAIIAIPIFIALGFPAVTAVVLSLIGDSVPVIFGAVGLPITYGIAAALPIGSEVILKSLPIFIASLNILGSVFIPFILLLIYSRMEKKPVRYFLEFLPFALVVGLVTSFTAIITAQLWGAELPSIVGGLAAIGITSFMAYKKILLPNSSLMLEKNIGEQISLHHIFKSILPYLIILSLLLLSRLPILPIKDALLNLYPLSIESFIGFDIAYVFYPFYSAGVIMLFSALIYFILIGIRSFELKEILSASLHRVIKPIIALILVLAFVQIYLYSGENLSGLSSMFIVMANSATAFSGPVWPLLAPFLGALGSFVSGSATVSNLIFANFQYNTAITSSFSPVLILSLQGLGAAAGNMIAMHNIIAALMVAGISGSEHKIIQRILPYLILYLLLIGSLGYILTLL